MIGRPDAPAFAAALERTRRLSPFVERSLAARPGLERIVESHHASPFTREEMRAALAGPEAGLAERLRWLRGSVLVSLAHRDLNRLASLDEVFATMGALAEVAVQAAIERATAERTALHGEAPPMIIAALGKLGGGELNVSSDIDLVFLYAEEGDTRGPKPVSHREFHEAAGRAAIALLSETTAEGIAFRVDMRLRPYGDSGALAYSLPALESYFVAQARAWERYAWLKARVIAGESAEAMALAEPFVYRRYLDFGMIAALRELRDRIFEAAVKRRKADDIKVGAGGIREIEFVAQLFQMVRGGRDAGLRTPSTRAALAALGERGLIDAQRARSLLEAYAFLRRLEHRLQYYDDQQTQSLPQDERQRALIAESMDFPDYGALMEALDRHRRVVQTAFEQLFEGAPAAAHPAAAAVASSLNDPQATVDPEALAEDLAEAGVGEEGAAAARLIEFTRSRRYSALSATGRAKTDALLPEVIASAVAEGGAAATIDRLLSLLEAIDRRESYLSLLIEYPRVLARAAHLVAQSLWAARLLARHPILLDELTRSAASFTATDWTAERRELGAECRALRPDVERLLDTLRHAKQRQLLRLTIADLEGALGVMALSDELTALADVLLDTTLEEASASLGLEGGAGGFGIVGYGKLGGKELGYGSDLDLIFLYADEAAPHAERFARVAQRVNAWLTSYTSAGVLYETDLRLRPDGAAGLLVTSFSAYRDYQLHRAWTWEHQALTRARFCAGDTALGERFDELRDAILAIERDVPKLLEEIRAMRAKMRAEHRAEKNDIKHVAGGLIDLEFCVQALVLAHSPHHPALRENKGNHMLLRRAGELGLIDAEIANAAADAYLALRRRAHQAALNDEEKALVADGELAAEREAVLELQAAVFS